VNSIEAVSLDIFSAPSGSPVDALLLGTGAVVLVEGAAELVALAVDALLPADEVTLGLELVALPDETPPTVAPLDTATLAAALPEGTPLVGECAVALPVAGGAAVDVGPTPVLRADALADAEVSCGVEPRFSPLQPNATLRQRAAPGSKTECRSARI